MGLLSSLNREQKEALGLLQIGTFLEYFDLMLYIHMAVLLNELFFPPSDPHTASILAATAFCSTYVMRPLGALIFGRLGDTIGRKSTIIMTTMLMSISCIIMATLPTYAQIGISAAWIMTFCRMAQGMSSMGELIGAEIYIAESIPRPASYPAAAFVGVAAAVGAAAAVGIAALVTSFYMNWRVAFWIGGGIAFIGTIARTRLRETPEFLKLKRQQMKEALEELHKDIKEEQKRPMAERRTWKESVTIKTLISYFFIYCGWPLVFYLSFMYFNPILKARFGYSSEDVIKHNFLLSLISALSLTFWAFVSYCVHPIKILKTRGLFALLLMIALPFLIVSANSALQLFLIQMFILILPLGSLPAEAVLIYHLPTWRRFTYGSFLYALSRALIYIITSFSLVYLGSYFGHFGLWVVTLPITIAYLYGVLHFESLERRMGMFAPNNPFYKTDLLKKGWFKA